MKPFLSKTVHTSLPHLGLPFQQGRRLPKCSPKKENKKKSPSTYALNTTHCFHPSLFFLLLSPNSFTYGLKAKVLSIAMAQLQSPKNLFPFRRLIVVVVVRLPLPLPKQPFPLFLFCLRSTHTHGHFLLLPFPLPFHCQLIKIMRSSQFLNDQNSRKTSSPLKAPYHSAETSHKTIFSPDHCIEPARPSLLLLNTQTQEGALRGGQDSITF